MTDKAENYRNQISGAADRDALQNIEISIKRDQELTFQEKAELLQASEGRDYTLRNTGEALRIMNILFFRAKAEMDAYHDMSRRPESWTQEEIAEQRTRFISVWQVIEEAELVGEYEAWKYGGCPV